jgi:hypothetical protein
MDEFLHVANGTSTTMTIEAARIPGAVSIWADPLHDGPVPGGLSDAELLDVRARHLGGGDEPSFSDTVRGLTEWRRVIADHASYGELVLWYEHDLFCQLNLIQLLTWIREHVPPSRPVSLICIDSYPRRPSFKGLGELTVSELAPLLDTRQPVTDEQYAVAGRVWHAFREPTPEPLDRQRESDTSALPYLASAITGFLREFPWTTDGLSRSERRLLQLAAAGSLTLAEAFPRMDDGQRVYYVTDTSLNDLADELAASTPPLLTASGGEMLRRTVAITDTGREVLAGRLDRVAVCGLDRWCGGTHLQTGNMWRWDEDRQRIGRHDFFQT